MSLAPGAFFGVYLEDQLVGIKEPSVDKLDHWEDVSTTVFDLENRYVSCFTNVKLILIKLLS